MTEEKKEELNTPDGIERHSPNHVTRMVLRRSHNLKDVRSFDSLDALLIDLGLSKP